MFNCQRTTVQHCQRTGKLNRPMSNYIYLIIFFTLSHSLLGELEYFHFQVCNTVQEQQCNTVNEQKCETKYETVNEQQCSTVQEQQCNTVNEQQCSTVNEQQCSTVQEQQCRTVQDTVNEQVRSMSCGFTYFPTYV